MTDTAILSNKFTLSSLPESVLPRSSLLPTFDTAAKQRFIYVCAPAGSGKTVSALLWLEHSGLETIWIGLDKYDSAPSVFFKQIALGLFSKQPGNEGMLKVINSPTFSASPVEHAIALINEMHPDDTPGAIVLDDLHLICNNEIFKAMPFIIKRLPKNVTVVILSRFAPPPELMPLISFDNLIGEDMLRFSVDEISSYFSICGQNITKMQSREIYDMTEGWVMGVNAVMHSGLRTKTDLIDFNFSGYFEAQIWELWSPELRKFCLDTAVLDDFSPELARIMTDRADAAAVLEELSRTNSFLSCIHSDLYRYHHIFQEFLRQKLFETKKSAAFYQKAARYYKEQGDYTRALRYMISSGDWKSVDSYLLLFLFKNDRGGIADYAGFLRGFFDNDFPEKAYHQMPVLHVLAAWYYYITGRADEYALHMDSIVKKLPAIAKAGNEFVEFSILAFSVDHRRTMAAKSKLYGIFSKFLKQYTPEGLATNIASYTHGLPFISRSNVDYNEFALDPDWREHLHKTFGQFLGREWEYLPDAFDATVAYERGSFKEALSLINISEANIKPIHKIDGRIVVAFLKYSILEHLKAAGQSGQPFAGEATDAFLTLEKLTETEAQDFIPNLKALQTKLSLYKNEDEAAIIWLDEYFVVEVSHIELFRLYQHFTTARAFIAAGRFEEAEKLLSLLANYGKNHNRTVDECEALVIFAVLRQLQGDKKGAVSFLTSALEKLSPYGYITLIADEGTAVEPILKSILRKMSGEDYDGSLSRAYVNEVLMSAHAQAKHRPNYLLNIKNNLLKMGGKDLANVKLSHRQKQMLTLLAEGRHTAEICAATGLSLSTVKTHLYFAYKKLNVGDALDAVIRARELGLL